MKIYLAFTLSLMVTLASGQLYFNQASPPYPYQAQSHNQIQHQVPVAHRAVVENSYRESMLPDEFMNKFYKNPRIAEALAKQSWFTNEEMPVFDRAAEKIPREMVFKIFKNAGWIKRR